MKFLTIFLFLFSFSILASEADDYKERVEWVKTLKDLFLETERNSEIDQTVTQIQFIKQFKLINKAWAASAECFFAGWPSEVRRAGGKTFCTSPLNAKLDYQAGNCKSGELQCQPLLFGKNICVNFKTPADKSMALAKCDQKFKEQKRDHSFLKELTPQEANDLQNLSILAHKVCEEGSVGIQKNTGMCKKLISKFDDGMLSIARSQKREIASTQVPIEPIRRTASAQAKEAHEHDEDCPTDHLEVFKKDGIKDVLSVGDANLELMYENLKKDFQNSPHCQAENVLHRPDIPNTLLINKMSYELGFLDYVTRPEKWNQDKLQALMNEYGVSASVQRESLSFFSRFSQNPQGSAKEIKRIILQDYAINASKRNIEKRDEIKKLLVQKHIFKESNGQIECPFMSKDSFLKAIKGMQNLKKKRSVKKDNLLTVVDYTQPSNERRLFVIDLEKNKIVHNTWVAHGGGGDNVFGADGLGGSPTMSNRPGSNQSSEGFIIAGTPSYGNRFGNNLILNGVDRNNTNMKSRAVIMHGWDSPGEEFVNGLVRSRGARPVDVSSNLTRLNSSSSKEEVDQVIADLKSATFVDKILRPTEGCLGVPRVNMSHLDPKRREKSMIDVLREDLAGTVIFNYSGEKMKSNYF